MKKQKQNRAITMIALIITVIVILILAGVSINFIKGQDSIFNKTQTAVQQYQNEQEKENYILAKTQELINNRETVTIDKKEYEDMKAKINALTNYSTGEQVVGSWIDGKPLYQKTFVKENISVGGNTTTEVDMGTGAQNCKLIAAFGAREDSETIPYSWPSLSIIGCIDSSNNKFLLKIYRTGSSFNIPKITMTYQYTKTTD